MALQHINVEVQSKLVEFAWEAAKKVGYGGDSGSHAVKVLVGHFSDALDGFARAWLAAGAEKKEQ